MKTKRLFLKSALFVTVVSLALTDCRKKDQSDNDTSEASDNNLSEQNFNDMHQVSDEAAKGSVSDYRTIDNEGILSGCATVTWQDSSHFTIDFGSVNCLGKDGRYRRGLVHVSFAPGKHYFDTLAYVSLTTNPENSYFVNDNQVIGTHSIYSKGHNSAHHLNWDITVNGQIVKASGGGTVTWNSSRNREMVAGESTPPPFWLDDVYNITGSASGTSAKGTPFTVNITSPLVKAMNCRWFESGTVDFTPGSKPTRHVDFGNGTCDNIATVTINSNVYIIYMH